MNFHGLSISGIIIRFILGGGAVAASYVFARRLGGKWGGIFAAFPAVYIASIITVAIGLPRNEGLPLAIQVSKGALVGMFSNIACAVAASLIIPRCGWRKGLAYALFVWFVCVGVIYFAVIKAGLVG